MIFQSKMRSPKALALSVMAQASDLPAWAECGVEVPSLVSSTPTS
jgi:hypothetical protein